VIDKERVIELLSRLPLPPEEEKMPSGVSEKELSEFQERTGVILPAELRAWLGIANAPFIGSQGAFGINARKQFLEIESYWGLYPGWRDRDWIPIGTDGSGNYYVVPTREEFGQGFPVLFIDTHEDSGSPAYIVASSVGYFVEFWMERELGISKWPFDEAEVIAKDPLILTFEGVDLPWEPHR
jgi:hypothetical protein